MMKNPVMFVVEVVAALTTVIFVRDWVNGGEQPRLHRSRSLSGCGSPSCSPTSPKPWRRAAARPRRQRCARLRDETMAKLIVDAKQGLIVPTPAAKLGVGQIVLVEAGDLIPSDGEVIEGVASVNEAAITGESAPVIREVRRRPLGRHRRHAGGLRLDQGAHHRGARLDLPRPHDRPGRRRAAPEDAERDRAEHSARRHDDHLRASPRRPSRASRLMPAGTISVVVLVALFVTLIPTTIGALLSAIGIAGMDRLVRFNVLAMSGRAVEAAGDVDTLLLDKTGTITLGNRQATEFKPVPGVSEQELADAAQLASLADETPEGRSIVVLAKEKYGIRGRDIHELGAKFIPFTAQSRMSGVEINGSWVRKGAVDAILDYLKIRRPRRRPAAGRKAGVSAELTREVNALAESIAKSGGTPLAVAKDGRLLGVIHLKDIVKGGIRERFAELRRMGIRTVMITGDNPHDRGGHRR